MSKRLFLYQLSVVVFLVMAVVLVGCVDTTEQFKLTIDIEGNGSVEPDKGEFDKEAIVVLTVTPDEGDYFAGWEGLNAKDVSDTTDKGKYIITMDGNKELTAVLKPKEEKLDNSYFNFEGTDHGFEVEFGTADMSIDNNKAYLGNSSLRIDYKYIPDEKVNIYFYKIDAALPYTKYTFRLYVPSESGIFSVQPFVQHQPAYAEWYSDGGVYYLEEEDYDKWLEFEVDMTKVKNIGIGIYKLGVQIEANADGTIWLDSIDFTRQEEVADLSDYVLKDHPYGGKDLDDLEIVKLTGPTGENIELLKITSSSSAYSANNDEYGNAVEYVFEKTKDFSNYSFITFWVWAEDNVRIEPIFQNEREPHWNIHKGESHIINRDGRWYKMNIMLDKYVESTGFGDPLDLWDIKKIAFEIMNPATFYISNPLANPVN